MAWRKLWQYEASNPQRLSVAFLQARIEFTFNQALLPLRYVPQTWHEAASAMQALGHVDKARDYWTRGGEVLPESDALHLALARFEEAQARPTEARQVLEALVSRRPTPLNFILLMRFSFRAEGLKEARKVFTRGRKAESCTWHVYAAAADMEHLLGSGNEGALVAQRIYALGADKFPTEVPFLLKYLQFLLARPDLTNVRAVLERALQAVHCEAVQRGTAARDHQVRQLCARCVLGWRGVVTQRAHKHRALLHYAMALSARCLLGWATWLAARRRKRPRARQRSLLCAHAAKRRALGQWAEAAAVRRGGEHRVRRARERWACRSSWRRSGSASRRRRSGG